MKTTALFALLLASAPRTGLAQSTASSASNKHFDAGLSAFGEKDYARASTELELAYQQNSKPVVLFAWAQAERLRGDCRHAIELYRKYMETGPEAAQQKAAEQGIGKCEPLVKVETAPAEQPSPEIKAPPPRPEEHPVAEAKVAPPNRSWYEDPVGDALALGGAVGVGVGVGFFVSASASQSRADRATVYQQYSDDVDSAKGQRSAGWVGVGVGGGLLMAAVTRYLLLGDSTASTRVGLEVHGRGAELVVKGPIY